MGSQSRHSRNEDTAMQTLTEIVAEAVAEQAPDVAEMLIGCIEAHGLEFVIGDDGAITFSTAGIPFCRVTREVRPLAAAPSRTQ